MEVAGLAVGVVSLGITVCDGVTQYCRDWNHQHENVRTLNESTNGLRCVLQEVQTLMLQHPTIDPALVATLDSSVKACNDQISKVRKISDKYAERQATGKRETMKEAVQRLKFPFEAKVLDELRDVIHTFRANVDLALNLLTVRHIAAVGEAVDNLRDGNKIGQREVISKVQEVGVHTAQSLTNVLDQKLPALEQSLTASVTRRVDDSASSVERRVVQKVETKSEEIILRQRNLQKQFEQMASNQAQFFNSLLAGDTHIQGRSESVLTSDTTWSLPRKKPRHSWQDRQADLSQCTCNVKGHHTSENRGFALGPRLGCLTLALYEKVDTSVIHDRRCPLWYTSKKDCVYRSHMRVWNRHISGSIKFQRSLHAKFSGLEISPRLSFRPVVPYDSSSFRVIRRYSSFVPDPNVAMRCLKDLRVVFQNGLGSPLDVLPSGRTLLHHAAAYGDMETFVPLLTKGLLAMGYDIHFGGEYRDDTIIVQRGPFPYEEATSSQRSLAFSKWLVEHDLPFSPIGWFSDTFSADSSLDSLYALKNAVNAQELYVDFAKAVDCGILSMAVLRRDLPLMKALLVQRPQLLKSERNTFGQSPVFLAVGWPAGLATLLECGDDNSVMRDSCAPLSSLTPLDYAIGVNCLRSMTLLADKGLAFNFEWSHYVTDTALQDSVRAFLLALIVQRSHDMHSYALAMLPHQRIASFQLQDFDVFSSQMRTVLEHLASKSANVPPQFCFPAWDQTYVYFAPDFGGIFHERRLPLTAASAFYDAGFANVDQQCVGLTPLMCLKEPKYSYTSREFFARAEFLVAKGASLKRDIPLRYIIGIFASNPGIQRRHQTVHQVASLCWLGVFHQDRLESPGLQISELHSSEIWKSILTDTTSDPCLCACSSGGCRPICLALKSSLGTGTETYPCWPYMRKHFLDLKNWDRNMEQLSFLATLLEGLPAQHMARDVVQFLTFSALELTHTCCQHNGDFSPHNFSHSLDDESDSHLNDREIHHPHKNTMIRHLDSTDVDEIREEEECDIRRLNALVDEFMEDMERNGIPLTEFIQTTWPGRMFTELSADDEGSETELNAIRELGVAILDDDDEDEPEIQVPVKRVRDRGEEYDEWIAGLESNLR